jgi:hypothetical protein
MQPAYPIESTPSNPGVQDESLAASARNWNYRQFFIRPLKNLECIRDDSTADAVIRTVVGILCCAVSEKNARRLIRHLPNPLTLQTLRGVRQDPSPVSHDECVAVISRKFQVSPETAARLTQTVLDSVKCAVGEIILLESAKSLGEDWYRAAAGP